MGYSEVRNVVVSLRGYIRSSLWGGLAVGLFFLVSCTVDLPAYVISEGKMEKILYDYHLAQGMAEAAGGDVEANRYLYVQKVFEKYNVTEAMFDTSMVWYSGHASHLEKMYARIDARLERESREAGLNIPEEDQYARFTAEGDTANIWQGRDLIFLHGNREDNLYTLVIPADSSFHRGDYFMLRFGNRFIVQEGQREGFALLQVKYDNDSVVAATQMISGDNELTLYIPKTKVPVDHEIKSLSCTFYHSFDEHKSDVFRLWIVRKPVLLRYHVAEDLLSDSTQVEIPDTLGTDTILPASRRQGTRMAPDEFRSTQQVDKKINVVEKRKVVLPGNNRGTTRRRIQ